MPYDKTIDAHTHITGGLSAVAEFLRMQREFGYSASNFLSCECIPGWKAQNALGIYLKHAAPENYVFGGLHHRYAYDYAEEAATLFDMGFDGIKIIDNKPTVRKALGIPQNDPSYDGFYAYVEKNKRPVLTHVADPEEFWHRDLIPEWGFAAGYFYGGGGYVDKESLYRETVDVLARFPGVKIILAHLFFMSGDLERLTALMEKFPNVCLDIVPGTEMYWNFAKRPDDWRAFFLKYQDRIIFGTDNINTDSDGEMENIKITNGLATGFLTRQGEVNAWDKHTVGVHLPGEVRAKICGRNFQALAGDSPAPLNYGAASAYLEKRLSDGRYVMEKDERETVAAVLREISAH
ncbi:MAG: amidohydrolase [Clostridiales bacterium]|jgi:predicted TIM-barrel fold metal-dependent hydrolase|nr:amidohydrolase [Clostridiales bacterium]